MIYPVKYFLCLMLLFSSSFYTPYLLFDMAAFNLTGQGMQCNAEVGLFTKPSIMVLSPGRCFLPFMKGQFPIERSGYGFFTIRGDGGP
jgi:hypothetical protein